MLRLGLGVVALLLFVGACNDSSDVSTLAITMNENGCSPAAFEVDAGREARLTIENETEAEFTIRDGDGRLEEVLIEPDGRTDAFFPVPEGAGTYVLLCESEDGASEIELRAGGGGAGDPLAEGATATPAQAEPDGTLGVSLLDYEISPSEETIRSGRYNIIATNTSSGSVHELNLLKLQPDGNFVNVAQIPPMAPQQGGAVLASIGPGSYRLACQIMIGESGSTVDHYQQGMWFDIVVLADEE